MTRKGSTSDGVPTRDGAADALAASALRTALLGCVIWPVLHPFAFFKSARALHGGGRLTELGRRKALGAACISLLSFLVLGLVLNAVLFSGSAPMRMTVISRAPPDPDASPFDLPSFSMTIPGSRSVPPEVSREGFDDTIASLDWQGMNNTIRLYSPSGHTIYMRGRVDGTFRAYMRDHAGERVFDVRPGSVEEMHEIVVEHVGDWF